MSGGNNVNSYYLLANESNAEGTSTSLSIDLLSNGFKIKNNDTAYGTDQQYIYYAVGQSIVGSNNTPATAR